MTRHPLEVADVFRRYACEFLQQYGNSLSVDQWRAFNAIVACRTSALGGHMEKCDHCGHERNAYNSCRNRNCPKCQALEQAKWADARMAELLPIPYFFVTLTLPKQLGPIALQNKRVVYGILFRAASQTLQELGADPKHLGAKLGILAVLHSWGQKVDWHVHLHCIVTSGGIAPDGSRWIHGKCSKKSGKPFFVHVTVLSRVFRGKFLDLLKRAYRKGELAFHGDIAGLSDPDKFEKHLNEAVEHDWVVHVEPPRGTPDRVVKYLARYTHRVAISNSRLVAMKDGRVYFRYKDYADDKKMTTTSLPVIEFIRRFLLHVLPSGFMKIRYYGFLANCVRRKNLEVCRQLLGVSSESADEGEKDESAPSLPEEQGKTRCPLCGKGVMVKVGSIPRMIERSSSPRSRSPPVSRVA